MRSITIAALIIAFGALSAPLAGCSGPHPSITDGDANSVEVRYAGDVATALPLATKHCAQYERVPRLVDPGLDSAIFACVRK